MFDVITIGSATRDGFFEGVDFLSVEGKCFATDRGICLPLGAKIKVPNTGTSSCGFEKMFPR